MKLKNLWLIAVAILIYACNAEETRSWEVTFDPNKPKDPNEQSIINVAAGKFYKMNVVANSAYADKAPLDPWTSGTKLTDEETGTLSTKNRGVGWDAQTVEVIIDLGSLRSITEVSVHAISDPTSQIVFPAQIEVSTTRTQSQPYAHHYRPSVVLTADSPVCRSVRIHPGYPRHSICSE